MTLQDFLTEYGPPLAQRVIDTFTILHDPVRDAAATPTYTTALARLGRPCLPAQAEAAKAVARAFFEAGEHSVYVSGEMGVGKCQIALALLALTPRPFRALVMCPPHIVPKWKRECTTVLPHARAISLNGPNTLERLVTLANLKASGQLAAPTVPEVWILGRERAKLHHAWRPAYITRRISHRPETSAGTPARLAVTPAPACPRCFSLLLDKDGLPLPVDVLTRKRTRCVHCGEALYTADRTGPRRYAPAEFIRRYLPDTFDLVVADEVHELKGEGTGQGNAFGALARACRYTVALTGTLLGGYAQNLLYLLWRTHPTRMHLEGFDYRKAQDWVEKYGILERTTIIDPGEDDGPDARVVRGKATRTTVRQKPGISPLVLGTHLLPNTVFLRLADVADSLPPYEERVVSLVMSPGLQEAYTTLEHNLLHHVHQALKHNSTYLLATYLQSLLCYPDQAAFRAEEVHDPRTGALLASAPIVPGPLPKEQALLDLCTTEVRQRGRRVLLYVTFTNTRDLTGRLQTLLTDAGFRVAILKGTVPPAQRESWIQRRVAEGIEVLITNPELVKTGLDLYDFPTFAYVSPGYSIYTLRQAARRAWRIGQTKPCEVVFFNYAETMQSRALTLIASKLEASLAIEGELSDAGLSALAENNDSLLMELARSLAARVQTPDSAEVMWARLRKRTIEQMLTLTSATPPPPVTAIAPAITKIGPKTLIVDLIEHPRPHIKRISRVEVSDRDLADLLAERPHIAQLALF